MAKLEKEFKILNHIGFIRERYLSQGFSKSRHIIHSNMHFQLNGKTVKLRVYHTNDNSDDPKLSLISKFDVDGGGLIKSKNETETFLTVDQFIIQLEFFRNHVSTKDIVFYTIGKDRYSDVINNEIIGNVTVDYCTFIPMKLTLDILGLNGADNSHLEWFLNNLNKSNRKLSIGIPYIEVESLDKKVSVKKLLKFIKNDLAAYGIDNEIIESLYISDKGIATIASLTMNTFDKLVLKKPKSSSGSKPSKSDKDKSSKVKK